MDKKQFKIWLINNNHTRASLASYLDLHINTIANYCKNDRFPKPFVMALGLIELNNKQG